MRDLRARFAGTTVVSPRAGPRQPAAARPEKWPARPFFSCNRCRILYKQLTKISGVHGGATTRVAS